MTIKKITVITLFFGILISCSKTEIEPEITHKAEATFVLTGTQTWPQRFTVAFGAFEGTSVTPLAYSEITQPSENGSVTVSLNFPGKADNLRLYLANSAKQVVATFYQYSIENNTTDLHLPSQTVDLVTFTRVQKQIFNSCATCHGGSSGEPAAGLNLTESSSWSNLVNVASSLSGKKRVVPSDTANSFIIDIMRLRNLSFVHTASYSLTGEDIELTKAWIVKGAFND